MTTRHTDDAYTAYRALTKDVGPDGGGFVPFRLPVLTKEKIAEFKDKTFNQTVAEILNMFFSLRLNGWDLDLVAGKGMVRLAPMNHRIIVAELWHNLEGRLSYVEGVLRKKLAEEAKADGVAEWSQIAVRIAVFFGVYGQLLRDDHVNIDEEIDFSVNNDDFVSPIAILYCRKMGLPVNMIVCTCDESNNLWDFIHRGTISTVGISKQLQIGLERLLHATLGCDAAVLFCEACAKSRAFSVPKEALPVLNSGLFCSVAGKDRAKSVINSLYRTNSYIIDSNTALCYGGLQDYRAKTGASGLTVILAESTPVNHLDEIAAATGLDASAIKNYIIQP